ncbi:hypothetical protein BJV78DRAFT_1355869 [Lactifluus subvellereus]|nr:hypothetical protein BJV78DRAFT_1355869 [Lactifluus subvellereus]
MATGAVTMELGASLPGLDVWTYHTVRKYDDLLYRCMVTLWVEQLAAIDDVIRESQPRQPSGPVTNTHQAELVAQLRQEAQQWRGQLRLEETLPGEISAWKDQFLRIHAEHAHLLNQLSSQATLAHTPKGVPVSTVDSSATSSSTKRASASSSTARADERQCDHRPYSPTKALPPPCVVRRVQAVIEVPVKSVDEVDEGGEGPSDEASCGECVDEEEGENAGIGTLTARGNTMPWDRQYTYHKPDGEDDELMMYASLKDGAIETHINLPPTCPSGAFLEAALRCEERAIKDSDGENIRTYDVKVGKRLARFAMSNGDGRDFVIEEHAYAVVARSVSRCSRNTDRAMH